MGGALTRMLGRSPSGATDPSFASVKLLLGANGADGSTTFVDESPVGRTLTTVGNAQIDTAQSKFGGASALFDGAGDYLTAPDSADWDFGASPFTIECWVRFNSGPPSTTAYFCSQWDPLATNSQAWAFGYSTAVSGLRFIYTSTGLASIVASGGWTPTTGVWYHVAVDRDASNVFRLYVNGAMIGSSTHTEAINNSANLLSIARLQHGTPSYLDGWLDELRITKGVARYGSDSGYTTPTAAFPRS